MRHLAPSGTPITVKDLSFWVGSLFSCRQESVERFKEDLCRNFQAKYCFFLSTGRAAMTVLLASLSQHADRGKNTVIIPSYTCYSVPASIIKAGLQIKICDINRETLDYDYEQLESLDYSAILAVISSNLYGIPGNLERLEKICRKKDVFMVDDAAQSMGGTSFSGRLAGTFGDAGIFSLDKGKVITSMNGGIIITSSAELAESIASQLQKLPTPPLTRRSVEMIKMLIYTVFLHPHLYWLPANLPFLGLGTTLYTTNYPLERYNAILGGMAHSLFRRLHQINRTRVANGCYYKDHLPADEHLRHITTPTESRPIFLRFPILVTDESLRARILETLQKNRLGATGSFPTAIADIAELQQMITEGPDNSAAGRAVARQIITLPTHPFVSRTDQDKILTLIKSRLP
jgi:perosamine synthetase